MGGHTWRWVIPLRHAGSTIQLLVAAALLTSACGDARELEPASTLDGCSRCHGSADNAAPPTSTLGATETTERAVGAHQRHLRPGLLRAALACDDCHVVPEPAVSSR